MSWAVAAVAGGTALKVGGGMLDRNSALANAEAQAKARNESLAKNIGLLDEFGDQNKGVFNADVGGYAPSEQTAALANAQQARGASAVYNMSPMETGSDAPIQSDASPASRSDLAKRMLAVHDLSTKRAKAMGRLGGYSDAWMANELRDKQAGRDIDTTNNMAHGRKGLIGPEGDLAAAAAYKPPSPWGAVLSGAGSALAGYGGANLGGGGSGGWTGGYGGGGVGDQGPTVAMLNAPKKSGFFG